MTRKILSLYFIAALIVVSLTCLYAREEPQEKKAEGTPCSAEKEQTASAEDYSSETDGNVPELFEFHKVIYLIWHEAYPVKDYDALKGYLPDIFTYTEKLYNAKLPGILRDKEAKWKEGIAELKRAVNDYSAAVRNNNNEALLNAAENLHSRFEMLVRIIRPILPEVDRFHRVLYVVYHKFLPNKEYGKIRDVSEDLKLKAEAIMAAELPRRLQPKTEQFKAKAQALYTAASELEKICTMNDGNAVERAVENLHAAYQNIEAIFD